MQTLYLFTTLTGSLLNGSDVVVVVCCTCAPIRFTEKWKSFHLIRGERCLPFISILLQRRCVRTRITRVLPGPIYAGDGRGFWPRVDGRNNGSVPLCTNLFIYLFVRVKLRAKDDRKEHML